MGDSSPGKSAGINVDNRSKGCINSKQNCSKIAKVMCRTESLIDAVFDIGITNHFFHTDHK